MSALFYDSLEGKRLFFNSPNCEQFWKIDDKEMLASFLSYLDTNKSKCIFRGHNDARYRLFTLLQRHYLDSKIHHTLPMMAFANEEVENLKQNKGKDSALKRYFSRLTPYHTDYLYLSFLQHYGAPTPLLDFTYNPKVAAFFATDGIVYGAGMTDVSEYISYYWINIKELCETIKSLPEELRNLMLLEDRNKEKTDSDNHIQPTLNSGLEMIQNYLTIEKLSLAINNNGGVLFMPNKRDTLRKATLCEIEQKYISLVPQRKYIHGRMSFSRYAQALFEHNTCITNLNLVAQDGCFILYTPPQYNTSLEEELIQIFGRPIIYCANIHKSLAMYLKDWHKRTTSDIYPEPRCLANIAYEKTKKFI